MSSSGGGAATVMGYALLLQTLFAAAAVTMDAFRVPRHRPGHWLRWSLYLAVALVGIVTFFSPSAVNPEPPGPCPERCPRSMDSGLGLYADLLATFLSFAFVAATAHSTKRAHRMISGQQVWTLATPEKGTIEAYRGR